MKKGIRIFLAFLAFNFFAQACFASAIEYPPDIPPEKEEEVEEKEEEIELTPFEKVLKFLALLVLLILFLVAYLLLPDWMRDSPGY